MIFYHLLHRGISQLFLLSDKVKVLIDFLLFILDLSSLFLFFQLSLFNFILDSFFNLLPHIHISFLKHPFLFLLVLQSLFFLPLCLLIPLLYLHDFSCFFLSILNFFPGLRIKKVRVIMLAFFSSSFKSIILFWSSFTSSSALFLACLDPMYCSVTDEAPAPSSYCST